MSNLTFNPKGHRYELDGKSVTGVTTVLNVLAKPALIGWAANMTAQWIRENCKRADHYNEAMEVPYSVFDVDLEQAVQAHTKKKEAGGDAGKALHSEVEAWIKVNLKDHEGKPVVRGPMSPGAEKFQAWAIANNVTFLASEQQVYSREWWCAGTFDFSFEKDGKRYIGDLKTHKKLWDRTPFFQTAAYMKMSEEMGEQKYDGSCIVNINKETNELTEHYTFDHENDKKAFEAALVLYRQLSNF